MLVCDVLLNEGGRYEQLLTVLAPEFAFTLLPDVWLCGKHEFPVIRTLGSLLVPRQIYEWTHSCWSLPP